MITLIKGTQAACGTDASGASIFGGAAAVRLVNTTATARFSRCCRLNSGIKIYRRIK